MSLLGSVTESKVNSLQLFQKIDKIISGWQGGARVGHRSAGGRILLPIVVGEQGVVASLSLEAESKP